MREVIAKYGVPEIFNTDQGSQFTSGDFTDLLKEHGIAISMGGKGCWCDNVFVERLWKSVKYEEVYLKPTTRCRPPRPAWARIWPSTTPAGRIARLAARRRMRSTSAACRRRGSRHDVSGLPTGPLASRLKGAGGGPVDNPAPQGSICPPGNSVQTNGARSLRNAVEQGNRQVATRYSVPLDSIAQMICAFFAAKATAATLAQVRS